MTPSRSGAASSGDQVRDRRLVAFPGWFQSNPYLNMLYLVPRSRGYEIVSRTRLEELIPLLATLHDGEVLHIHWTAPIVQYGAGRVDARRRLDRFARAVRSAKRRGARLVWTVHNRLPHECPYPDVERALLRFLADEADLVIAINPLTSEAMSDLVQLDPQRLAHLPHPHYQGQYANSIDREMARSHLGIAPESESVLFFGQMRRYKGLGDFFNAMDALRVRRSGITMLLAGKTTEGDQKWIDEMIPPGVTSVRRHEFVPDDEIQHWFRAADCVVLPFQNVLNSGSLFLAASFEAPLIVPRQPELLAEAGAWSFARFFDPQDPSALRRAIEETLDESRDGRPQHRFETERSPYRFSLAYDEMLRRIA